MKFYLGVTDTDWFRNLRALNPEDVNYWQPSGKPLIGLDRGAPFLFKLKAPYRKIGGVGFFSTFASFPLNIVWDAFGQRNGFSTKTELVNRIIAYRTKNHVASDPTLTIGCIVLTDPIFFNDDEMIPLPASWDDHTVKGKFYYDSEEDGAYLWDSVKLVLAARRFFDCKEESEEFPIAIQDPAYRQVASKVRIGQGAFRLMVTEAYERACAITGDHTLPVLEAAHIRPYAESGPHLVNNGLLLRADLHKLFDEGYMTVTPDYHVEISPAIREEFNNGRIYYSLHGQKLSKVPNRAVERPNRQFLIWHNENIFKAG